MNGTYLTAQQQETPGGGALSRAAAEAGFDPRAIWMRGALDVCACPAVSVAGTRSATLSCRRAIGELCTQLAGAQGVCIVSGGADGVDAAGHAAALAVGGATVLVSYLPAGVDGPDRWRGGLRRAWDWDRALLVSPIPAGTVTTRRDPVVRNRLVAALGRVAVIGETGLAGGTMHFVRFACEMRRTVFVLDAPGMDSRARSALRTASLRSDIRFWKPGQVRDGGLAREVAEMARLPFDDPGTCQMNLFDGEV